MPVVYDMRGVQQPVILNGNPFLALTTNSLPKLVKVDTYAASVNNRHTIVASSEYTTTEINSSGNSAQVNAFMKIGGQDNRVIRKVSVKAYCGMVYLIFAFINGGDIEAKGEVAQFDNPMASPVPLISTNTLASEKTSVSITTTNRSDP